MRAHSRHAVARLSAALFAATLLLALVAPALRTIADFESQLAHVSLRLCEIGVAVLRVCGI